MYLSTHSYERRVTKKYYLLRFNNNEWLIFWVDSSCYSINNILTLTTFRFLLCPSKDSVEKATGMIFPGEDLTFCFLNFQTWPLYRQTMRNYAIFIVFKTLLDTNTTVQVENINHMSVGKPGCCVFNVVFKYRVFFLMEQRKWLI